ncbi:multicopper oxidase family protein [Alkaliphilus crotonatoxidans]
MSKEIKGSTRASELTRPRIKVDPANPDTIPKFVDELTIPPVLKPRARVHSRSYYQIEMKAAMHRFHRCFPKTFIWGYGGISPGPTISTMRDEEVVVRWVNQLPLRHFLPIDRTLHSTMDTPEVRTVVHLHGAYIDSDSDGHPDAWFTRDLRTTGHKFVSNIYRYTNHQQAATLWYHDHTMGITRLNVYAGLAGFYLIRDRLEPRLKLPSGEYEIPLMIQDKSFNSDGSLFYPSQPPFPTPVNPSVVPAFLGNTIVVNGKVWPRLKVEPRRYRFRLLNASNTRSYTLKLSNDQDFYQIGTDGGLMSQPVSLKTLNLDPAERADIIIDFSRFRGQSIRLINDIDDPHTSQVMEFKVLLPLKGKDTSEIPNELYHIDPIMPQMATKERFLTLSGSTDRFGRPMLLLNNHMWHDPATEKPFLDSIEIWSFVNLTAFPHPMHLHLVQFQILDRIPFDVDHYNSTGEIKYTGAPIAPLESERGWKDVVRATAGQVTRIIAHFSQAGDYVWHCHILEHEDHDMMRPLQVVPCHCHDPHQEKPANGHDHSKVNNRKKITQKNHKKYSTQLRPST